MATTNNNNNILIFLLLTILYCQIYGQEEDGTDQSK
jgi:hypothetical protein